jgi:hypothetical protein
MILRANLHFLISILQIWFHKFEKTTFYSTKFQVGRRIPWFTQPLLHNRLKIPPTTYRTLHPQIIIDDWLLICELQNSAIRCHREQVVICVENSHLLWLTDKRCLVYLVAGFNTWSVTYSVLKTNNSNVVY